MTPDEVHNVAFIKPRIGRRGYDEQEVDAVLDLVEATLRGQPRISREQVAQVTFGKPPFGKRGYSEAEVDDFLHRVVAEWPIFQ